MSVYFITARCQGRVKIGYSDKPEARLTKAQVDSPVPLAFERVMDGGKETEAVLHRLFAADRVTGEWFVISDQIEDFMSGLAVPTITRKAEREAVNDGSDADLIIQCGGIRAVARALNHKWHTTVQGWFERSRIPEAHKAAVVALLMQKIAA